MTAPPPSPGDATAGATSPTAASPSPAASSAPPAATAPAASATPSPASFAPPPDEAAASGGTAPRHRRIEEAPPAPEPFLKQLASLFAEIPLLFSERVTLLALEMRRAGLALAQMVGLVVGAAVFVATAWLGLWAGLATALVHAGLGLGWVVLIVVGLNLAGAAWAVSRVKALAPRLTLPATLRHLTFNPARSTGRPTEPSAEHAGDQRRHDAETLAAARTAADAVAAAARSSAATGGPAATTTTTTKPPAGDAGPDREDRHARHD